MEKSPQISEAEYEIMKIIWSDSPISTNEVCEKAPKSHNWSNKTIHTLLSRLVAKHAISYEQRGRMYYYYPIISQKKYLSRFLLTDKQCDYFCLKAVDKIASDLSTGNNKKQHLIL